MIRLGSKHILRILPFSMLLIVPFNCVFASNFQLWEQNVTNVENFHAGRAVLANDASIAYDNPAGITRIKNQQMVAGIIGIFTNLKFSGDNDFCVGQTCTLHAQGIAQGGSFALLPDFHYVAPLSVNLGFGLSIVSPYGIDVEYGQNSVIANVVSRSRLQVIDIAPSLGFNINKKLSLGLGLDIEKMSGELDSILSIPPTVPTPLPLITKGYDTAYGFHLGVLYAFNEATRMGLTYHSKIIHHLKGTSNWIGAGPAIPGNPNPTRALTNVNLPPDTTLSIYRQLNSHWAVMGTVVYTQWNITHNLIIQNMAGLSGKPNDYPMNFRNTITFSIGADYIATDKLILRAGGGYDPSPVRNAYRTLQLPDTDRYDLAIGGHYQIMKALGFDLGWTHVFLKKGAVNPPLHNNFLSGQYTSRGNVRANADVVGGQLTWDFV